MKINVCVNGTFRYPQYIRRYQDAGVLGSFFYAHRRSTTAERMGLWPSAAHNVWLKEYALQGAWRALPEGLATRLDEPICDAWQRAVIRRWRPCDSVEAVIGAVADRVIAFAKAGGARVLGHPVCAHPETVAALVGRAHAELGLDPAGAVPVGMERRLAEIDSCDRLVVDSSFVARSFEEAGVRTERIAIVSPAVDRRRFHPRGASERNRNTFRVLCVGTITPRKGQRLLLRAWGQLKLPHAELVLIGPPGRHAEAVLRGFEGRFTHHPRVPNAALRKLLVSASVFVLPSVEDGFAQAPLEAMACGVPVIVTRNVGMADLLTHGRDGFVVPAFDVDRLAERLETLYRDGALADAMGEEASATAGRSGSWHDYADRVIGQHRMLLGASSALRPEAA